VLIKDDRGVWKRLCNASARGSLGKFREAFRGGKMVALVEAESPIRAVERATTQRRPDRLLYRDPAKTAICAVVYGGAGLEAFEAYVDAIRNDAGDEPGAYAAIVTESRIYRAEA